jgi:hypothetical protein
LTGAGYKGKLADFEISVKLRTFFYTHIDQFEEKKCCWMLFSDFFSFLGPKSKKKLL